MSRPDSILAIGLKSYLNKTRDQHRELGYLAFSSMVKGQAGISSMARSFNVSRDTMRKWIGVYRIESK